MPPGPHERPPARACGCAHHDMCTSPPSAPASPSRPLSPAARSCLSSAPHAAASVRRVCCVVRSSSRGAFAAGAWAVATTGACGARACSASWVLHRGARDRRDRVEKCCLLRAACTVLLDELTWVLHLRVLAQERRRLLQVELALLQVERPDAEDKFRVRARGRRRWTRRRRRQRARRSAATESAFSCCLQHHHRRPSLPVPRAASRRRSSGCHPRASCRVRAGCVPTASAPPGAGTSVRGQPHRPRKPRMCQ